MYVLSIQIYLVIVPWNCEFLNRGFTPRGSRLRNVCLSGFSGKASGCDFKKKSGGE